MSKLTVTEVQSILREMIGDISQFALKNNLQAFLLGGTLLGSVRENGFIAWDDDVDLGLRREEYDWFAKHYQPQNSRYQLIVEHDAQNEFPYMRLVDTKTTSTTPYFTTETGVFVDIFPIDQLSASRADLRLFYVKNHALNLGRNLMRSTNTYDEKARCVWLKKLAWRFVHHFEEHPFMLQKRHPHWWAKQQVASMQNFVRDHIGKKQVGVVNGVYRERELFDPDMWHKPTQVPFEGSLFWEVSDPDQYLTQLFGDWETPMQKEAKHGIYWYK